MRLCMHLNDVGRVPVSAVFCRRLGKQGHVLFTERGAFVESREDAPETPEPPKLCRVRVVGPRKCSKNQQSCRGSSIYVPPI